MQAMQKIPEKLRFYCKESIIYNQGTLDNKNSKFKNKNKNTIHSSNRF